jgi:hypothetical protein
LRDTIAELQQRGLNEEESFWLARRRVGQPQQLGEEFAKADPAKVWRERVFWMAAGCFAFSVPYTIIGRGEEILLRQVNLFGFFQAHHHLMWEIISVQILIGIILIANGWVARNCSTLLSWFFQSRLRMAIFIVTSNGIASAIQASWWKFFGGGSFTWISLWLNSIDSYLWFAIPLILFLPMQKRKTPKRA